MDSCEEGTRFGRARVEAAKTRDVQGCFHESLGIKFNSGSAEGSCAIQLDIETHNSVRHNAKCKTSRFGTIEQVRWRGSQKVLILFSRAVVIRPMSLLSHMSLLLLNPAVTSSFREHRNLYHTHCHPCRTLRRLRAFAQLKNIPPLRPRVWPVRKSDFSSMMYETA